MKNLLILIVFLAACVPITPQYGSGDFADKQFETNDKVYEENVKTVVFYPALGTGRDLVQSALLSIDQRADLILAFDILYNEYANLYYKIIHCNADWKISMLNSMEYMDDFNEFQINNYDASVATKVPFIHYRAIMPKVKLSGNYVVKVYRNKNEDDLMLSRRFVVYENKVRVNHSLKLSNVVSERDFNQQIDFAINYENYEITNPTQNIKVVIRQNQRWDNAIYNLPPMFVREDQKLLEYNYFNLENNFKGGNEFRAFDLRTLSSPGINVAKILNRNSIPDVLLATDKSRANLPYTRTFDINGKFIIENYDLGTQGATGSDYANVYFNLNAQPQNQKIYVFGAITDWQLRDEFLLKYDSASNLYQVRVMLKQGWYSYAYASAGKDGSADTMAFEGSHDDTENQYEIIIYARPVGSRADIVIGYQNMYFNPK